MTQNSFIVTFGCRLNTLESEKLKQSLREQNVHDVIVVNTCAVTAEAERQARQAIRKLRREHPHHKLVVTGCSATLQKALYEAMPEVDKVVTNRDKGHLLTLGLSANALLKEEFAAESALLAGFEGRSRAFLQIQNGCDNACTFCVIRIARGRSVSFPFEDILRQAQAFAEKGIQDITLTGVDIASYDNKGRTLGRLVQDLLTQLPSTVRLRLSSLDPARVDESLLEALQCPRLLPFWHLSLQSGDATVLRRMARRHTPEVILELAQKARRIRPDLLLGADIIVGFPGETEEMFQNTCRLVKQARVAWLHIFPYSDRPGTVAQGLTPKLSMAEKKDRLQRLRQVGQKVLEETMDSFVGTTVEALVERCEGGRCWGKTAHYLPFEAAATVPVGQFGDLCVKSVHLGETPCLEGGFEKVEEKNGGLL